MSKEWKFVLAYWFTVILAFALGLFVGCQTWGG